ncbi:MAG: asparagine synthetase [Candidatus Altiarchaeota archaeon]|nr:asparagine synthetase [Candidatus Altiarchaeota archaeon]
MEIKRYTDERMASTLKIQSCVLETVHRVFREEGFTQIMPVILSTTTDPLGPDPSASTIKKGEIEYLGQKLVLTQSMILHKQMALMGKLSKIFAVSPCIRLETPDRGATGRHLFEFSQVDFELGGAVMADVFGLMEEVLCEVLKDVKTKCHRDLTLLGRSLLVPTIPFKRFTTHELKEKYGDDWEASASKLAKEPFWVLCHEREFYDREDPKRPGHFLDYDLIYPEGFGEALSGGEREWEFDRLVKRITGGGKSTEEYGTYLDLAKKGKLRPSAGGGFGVERLVRFLTGAKHIKQVQLFPRVPGEEVHI